MTRSKHTPGPWRIETTKALDGTPYIQILCNFDDGTENVVCRMGISDGDSWGGYVGEEHDANLIVAAPVMFEALVGAERLIDAVCDEYPRHRPELDGVRTALKMARGEK